MTAVSKQDSKPFAWASAGAAGFKGAKKSTPFAAQETALNLVNKLKDHSVKVVSIVLKGLGSGRESAMKTIQAQGLAIDLILERTSYAFNGCRLPRRRRV